MVTRTIERELDEFGDRVDDGVFKVEISASSISARRYWKIYVKSDQTLYETIADPVKPEEARLRGKMLLALADEMERR